MSLGKVLERVKANGKLDRWQDEFGRKQVQAVVPDPDLIAFIVSYHRAMNGLSIQALASVAGVSLSSVERIERGEKVSTNTLGKVSDALEYPEGSFFAPRKVRSPDEVFAEFAEWFEFADSLQWIDVEIFRHHRHARALCMCEASLIDTSRITTDISSAMADLHDWLNCATLLRSDPMNSIDQTDEKVSFRKLNQDVVDAVRQVERIGEATCLFGMYEPEVFFQGKSLPNWRFGVLSFCPKDKDPCASKRRQVLAQRSIEL